MSSDAKPSGSGTAPSASDSVIPEAILDYPSQRLYFASLTALCQAIKAFDFFQYLFLPLDGQTTYGRKWFIADFLLCAGLARLRIPRLRYSKSVVALQIISLWLLDGVLFGGISLNLGGQTLTSVRSINFRNRGAVTSTPSVSGLWELVPSLRLDFWSEPDDRRDSHLLGQHTVRMSPISTANLNPYGQTYCLAAPGDSILIPVLLNNTHPNIVQYSLTPLGANERSKTKSELVELTSKDLQAIENERLEGLQIARTSTFKRDPDDFDEYDDDEDDEDSATSPALPHTQTRVHLRVNKPGRLRLERVVDSSNVDARLVYPGEVTIVPCPRAEFAAGAGAAGEDDTRCAVPGLTTGVGEELNLDIDVYGVPPLSLRWHKEVSGKRESYMVEGIEKPGHSHQEEERALAGTLGQRSPEDLRIPLTVTLDALGTHTYVLESITDAIGNTIGAGIGGATPEVSGLSVLLGSRGSSHVQANKTHKSVTILRRPSVSFQHCGPGKPASLLIGSETPLTIATDNADSLDAPWDVSVSFQPDTPDEGGKKRSKPWTQNFQTHGHKRELTVRANAPGEYTIVGVKGKYCEGDILSPETCKVIERPLPTAEIEWKKIHECSGDTGVSASLVMHGTPPFQVYYTMQHDKHRSDTKHQLFASSRGELTIQPDKSGHYVFQVTHISDANYKKVPIKGPTIDQVVHPPASAEFAHNVHGGRGKRQINSCSGNTVDVDINLRGTGPWNLEIQVVGPKGSEIIRVPKIATSQKTIQLPIPKEIDRDGGSFDIDLVGIEDAYGCKRSLQVPGLLVNVRRVKPTVRFYGRKNDRQVTMLDNERATLPLRLTGEAPWRMKYRRAEEPERTFTATLSSPNDELRVSEKGLYEILEIEDAQCPGTVTTGEATYLVQHVPRPSARLSPDVISTRDPLNGSHILPPICEGMSDHVDLELTGRPPFQLMYNIARDDEGGVINIHDRPTFSSIQSRSRFQLHTSEAARVYYEVKQIGDAAYPLAKNKNVMIPLSERLLFEQLVSRRPSARFKNSNHIAYCLNDPLTPNDPGPDGLVVLEGTPPFTLQLSIRDLATSSVRMESVEVRETTWKLNVPSYTFHSIGPHIVTIESVQDASQCEQNVQELSARTVWLDVAETAAIVPFDSRVDYCVGDAINFQLEGTPPWTIGYRVNGKSYTQEAKVSPFSVIQQQPGEFTVTSIAHQQKTCKTTVTDLRYAVHDFPAAQVGHGKRIVQDIHEGDQAEIVFTLIGEPPFTFTYQRSEISNRKGVLGKVLETHTVSGVTTKEYSIFSALEGTWTVTFIADRYCRYPPATPDGM
ncbi:hypothetical protein WOLCODRAFT_130155 [Wolfiporia cocos MD-104 SS10]|uniref:Nucleoporin Pom152 n=1 Tax=Wolfiporia cocos (strain MD-104) TaxID=742152 RepID=A0A2H3IVQ7_WOLCO|nr:hypothetical protein WOLCODRAFT_130155 [Wolfiporia cocos MD-104 SS10]